MDSLSCSITRLRGSRLVVVEVWKQRWRTKNQDIATPSLHLYLVAKLPSSATVQDALHSLGRIMFGCRIRISTGSSYCYVEELDLIGIDSLLQQCSERIQPRSIFTGQNPLRYLPLHHWRLSDVFVEFCLDELEPCQHVENTKHSQYLRYCTNDPENLPGYTPAWRKVPR